MEADAMKINGIEVEIGDMVVVEVVWPSGRRTQTSGALIAVLGDEVYVESSVGPVVAKADTMELLA
jgi:hypothetical protein